MTQMSDLHNWLIRHLNPHPTPQTVLHSWASLCDLQIHSWLWLFTEVGRNEPFPAFATHLPGWQLTDELLSVALCYCCHNRLSHLPDGCQKACQRQCTHTVSPLHLVSIMDLSVKHMWICDGQSCYFETEKLPTDNIMCWHLHHFFFYIGAWLKK